jgi:hypothetical protein
MPHFICASSNTVSLLRLGAGRGRDQRYRGGGRGRRRARSRPPRPRGRSSGLEGIGTAKLQPRAWVGRRHSSFDLAQSVCGVAVALWQVRIWPKERNFGIGCLYVAVDRLLTIWEPSAKISNNFRLFHHIV